MVGLTRMIYIHGIMIGAPVVSGGLKHRAVIPAAKTASTNVIISYRCPAKQPPAILQQ